jgi:hypothetical protein
MCTPQITINTITNATIIINTTSLTSKNCPRQRDSND